MTYRDWAFFDFVIFNRISNAPPYAYYKTARQSTSIQNGKFDKKISHLKAFNDFFVIEMSKTRVLLMLIVLFYTDWIYAKRVFLF